MRCLRIEEIGRGDARRRRHVLDDDGRLSRNMLGEIARQEAPREVVVVADRVTDDHPDLLVAVEVLCRLGMCITAAAKPHRGRSRESGDP
jgi:hypothetical protein